jgi:MoaA/NifB/PqqE/SkfB family radical SAM enzyme
MVAAVEIAKRRLTTLTHRIHTLPIVVLMAHSRCNCRCVMCDIWKANHDRRELTRDDLARHVAAFEKLNVQRFVLSGGEALLHANLWALCALLKGRPVRITLLTTGMTLQRYAADVVRWCDDVTVSIDGSPTVHNAIRNVPNAFERLSQGVAAVKAGRNDFRVTGRCVLQRRNFFDLPNIINTAHTLGLDQLSFLAADVSSSAFNRPVPWSDERVADVALSPSEVGEFAQIVEATIERYASDFVSGFIAESPEKLRRLARYYAALCGNTDFPENMCNAPWVSTVIEANGDVRPCFFHAKIGNAHEQPLDAILNAPGAIAFRGHLDVRRDPICRKCVCTLNLGPLVAV